jgi:DegV family protein with EDD domain
LTIAIVTDSTADIPEDILAELNIFKIPADLILENKTYLDGIDITRNEFYTKLPLLNALPTTAAPSTGRFHQLYAEVFDQGYTQIISIHVSSLLSGIYNAARLAAQEFRKPIQVIDSQQLSMGLGFQVIQAARCAKEGLASENILKEVASVLKRVKVFAMLDTFDYIQRSGRVSWAKARIGSILQIKPILELKGGEVIRRGTVRTRGKGIGHLADILLNLGHLEQLAILHTNAEDDGHRFIEKYASSRKSPALLVNVTTVIGTHVGPNALGFAAVVK